MSFDFDPNECYYIQSSDFRTNLELWEIEKDLVVLRSPADARLQRWIFIKQGPPENNEYKILSAATPLWTKHLYSPRYLTISGLSNATPFSSSTPPTAVIDSDNPSIWRIVYGPPNTSCLLATKVPGSPSLESFLRTNSEGSPDSMEHPQNSQYPPLNRTTYWNIIKHSRRSYPEIPSGRRYSIRNAGTGQYVQFQYGHPRWHLGPSQQRVGDIVINYVPNSDSISISLGDISENGVVIPEWGTLWIGGGLSYPHQWVLQRINDPSGGYLYYICALEDTSSVLSGETQVKPGQSGTYHEFKMTPQSPGDAKQQWKIQIAS